MNSRSRKTATRRRVRGFVLLEILIAVGMFAMGILGLARLTNSIVEANFERIEDQRVRAALASYLEEMYMRPDFPLTNEKIAMENGFEGIEIEQEIGELELKNDEGFVIPGMSKVKVTARATAGLAEIERSVVVYVRR